MEQFQRTQVILGKDNMEKLAKAKVLVFGVGGVGGSCVEALARTGIGEIGIVDKDSVSLTNINRQVIATLDTIGESKVDVMERRIKSINENCRVNKYFKFYLPENADEFDIEKYDYVIDAIDTITAKLDLIQRCIEKGIPIISSMGMGNKINPTQIEVADISKTSVCPLAKVMRTELRRRGINHLKVVYSKETPIKLGELPQEEQEINTGRRKDTPGSIAFVPSVAGYIIASEVIKDITGIDNK